MLIGIFLRHYKSYRNINFIPVSNGSSFTAFLGPNGSGKSSILDALDKFFNGGEWSINIHAKMEGGISTDDKVPFIAPVFLIEKPRLKGSQAHAELLSQYFWSTIYKPVDALSGYYSIREELSSLGYSSDTHYLLSIGKKSVKNTVFMGAFRGDGELQKVLSTEAIDEKELTGLLNEISALYAYFYIPVEADATVFSALESQHVLKLLDEDIRGKIEKAITAKTVSEINSSLKEFLDEISMSLEDYEYRGPYKNNLTMNDLVEKVFEAYFSIKILHGTRDSGSLPIRDMSAGEKRRALTDLAYSLLARSAIRSQSVILAIDEPDASLHTSACQEQFDKLARIPGLTIPETQVILTTHWYGFLPIVQTGVVHALSNNANKIEFNTFDLYNYREQIRQKIKSQGSSLALDIELKSHNDMIQSIVSSVIRDDAYNCILCEGLSDKIYLEYYLADLALLTNLRIIPLGGFKEVKRAYDYLINPLSDKEYIPKGKILCLVDTDRQLPSVFTTTCRNLEFKRIIYSAKYGDAILVNVDSEIRSPATEIEHALDPSWFLAVASTYPSEYGGDNLREIVVKDKYNVKDKCSYGFLDLTPSSEMRLMTDFFDKFDNKVKFAKEYSTYPLPDHVPMYIAQIKEYFLAENKKSKSN